jgi:hypothetical protein
MVEVCVEHSVSECTIGTLGPFTLSIFFFVKKRTYRQGCPNKEGKGRRRKRKEGKKKGQKGQILPEKKQVHMRKKYIELMKKRAKFGLFGLFFCLPKKETYGNQLGRRGSQLFLRGSYGFHFYSSSSESESSSTGRTR